MADPDRTQSLTEDDGPDDSRTLASVDGATLMPPSDSPTVGLPPQVPSVEATESSGTLILPTDLTVAPKESSAGPPEGLMTPAPPTLAPPRFDHPNTDETLAPPVSPVYAGEVTEQDALRSTPPSTESSGTLLDAHLLSGPSDPITCALPQVIARVTGPGRPPVDAPSTVARPVGMKTAHVPTVTLPKISGYEVLCELGRGGMGVVYKARQEGLNRIVALKMVLAAGRASAEELSRFRAEAEAVAFLQHPNIVQVYDVGAHQGTPYFSLEFCPGGTLADVVAGKPQSPRLAARIVRDLANAIHHAHQRHILHRDLKPANVLLAPEDVASQDRGSRSAERKTQKLASKPLVPAPQDKTTEPALHPSRSKSRGSGSVPVLLQGDVDLEHCVPKITDFGLAKRLEGDAGQTRDGSVMGTPSYMAPEQAQGKVRELGPPADVYALGAILYDLLTGNPPFRGDTVMDTLHQVINREPVAPQHLHSKVPADLDTICLKCLEKDPAKRYASADALAEDLRRFLDGEPILARPAAWWEKTVKWARRRPASAALLVVCALILAGLGVGGYIRAQQEATHAATEVALKEDALREKNEADEQRIRAEQLKGLAEEHFRKACAAVDTLLARVGHEKLAYEPRMEQIRRELLQKAASFYEGFLRERGDDPSVKWQTARTQKNLGDIQEMLGNPVVAEQRYKAALALFIELRAAAPNDPRYRRDLAAAEHNLGLLLLNEPDRVSEAEKALRSARNLRQGLVDEAANDESRSELAASDHALGLMLERREDYPDATVAFNAALEQQRKIAEASAQDERGITAWRDVARSENSLGRVAEADGRSKDAEKSFESARAILTHLVADAPKVPEIRQELGQTYGNLGRLRRDTDPTAAAKDYDEAVRMAERLVEDFPATPAYRQDLAAALNNLAIHLLTVGKKDDAEKALGRALSLKERLAFEIPWVADYRRDFGAALNNLGIQLRLQDRSGEADKVFRRAVKVLGDLVAEHGNEPVYQRELVRTLMNRALVRQSDGKPDEADSLLKQAMAIEEKLIARGAALPEDRSELNRMHVALGVLYQVQGQATAARDASKAREELARAESEYRSALEGFKNLADQYENKPDFRYQQALASSALAGLLSIRGQSADARMQWGNAAALLSPLVEQHPKVLGYRLDLGRTLNDWAKHCAQNGIMKEAAELWNRASATLTELVRVHPKDATSRQELAKVTNNLAIVALKANRLDDATEAYRRAVETMEGLPAGSRPSAGYRYDLMTRHRELALQLTDTGAPVQEVDAEWRRVIESCRKLVTEVPDNPQYECELGIADHKLAQQLLQQNRPADARPLLEEAAAAQRAAFKLAAAPSYKALLVDHLRLLETVLFQLDDHAAVATAVTEIVALKPGDTAGRHETAAEALSRCAALAAADPKLPEAKRRETSQGYADRAMSELQEAVKGGFKNANELKKKQFDALRQREDFKQLVKQLAE